MALSDSAVSELLDAFRAGDGIDLVRESVRLVLQELIEAEAAQVIGAGRYEQTPERGQRTQRCQAQGVDDQGGHCRVGDPEAAGRLVLPPRCWRPADPVQLIVFNESDGSAFALETGPHNQIVSALGFTLAALPAGIGPTPPARTSASPRRSSRWRG